MRPSKWIARLEDRAIAFYEKNKDRLPRYILIALILLYAAGFIIHSAVTGLNNVWRGGDEPLFTLNPVKNIASVFTPQGFGIIIFSVLMYCLFTGKGKDIISGYKTVKDKKRGMALSITANIGGERVQSSGSQQKMSEAIEKCLDMEKEINSLIDELIETKKKVIDTIEKIYSPTEYKILHMRYIQHISLKEIAIKLNREYSWVTTTHGRALKSVQNILDRE